MRELVGDDGDKLAVFLAGVVNDKKAKMADRLEATRILLEHGNEPLRYLLYHPCARVSS